MTNAIEDASKQLLTEALVQLEKALDGDVYLFHSEIGTGVDDITKAVIEELACDPDKHEALYVILTTTGGG